MTIVNEHGVERVPCPTSYIDRLNDTFHRMPANITLAGGKVDLRQTQAAQIAKIAARRGMVATIQPGLVLQTEIHSDRWYITFNEADEAHEEQWFFEASGGDSELYRAHEFEEFIQRFDVQREVFIQGGVVRYQT